jgi:heparinase II/III-like protein
MEFLMRKILIYVVLFAMNTLVILPAIAAGRIPFGKQSGGDKGENIFGADLAWIKVTNAVGERRKVSYPMILPKADSCEIKLGFAVKQPKIKSSKLLLSFFKINGIFDLRFSANNIYLENRTKKQQTVLAKFVANKPFIFKIKLDIKQKLLTAIYINGEQVKNFTPQPWIAGAVGKRIDIWGPTPSGVDFYYIKPAVVENSLPIASKIDTGSKAPWRIRPAPQMLEDRSRVGIFKAPWTPPKKLNIKVNSAHLATKKFPVTLFYSASELQKFPALLKTDPMVQKFWKRQIDYTKATLQHGGLKLPAKESQRYVYKLYGALRTLGFVHMVSGDKAVGQLLKALMLDLAKRPSEFWIHSALRRFDKSFPVAGLECASLTLAMASAYHWNRELFNTSETKIILDAIRYKGLYPCMRWLEKSAGSNNWLAVIATGALAGGRVLREEQCVEYATNKLKEWTTLIEDDGSYSEPLSYFAYGTEAFIHGALALGSKDSLALVQDSPLKGSLNYLAYNYVKARTPVNGCASYKVNFGDGDFPGAPSQTLCLYLTHAFKQGLGLWLMNEYYSPNASDNLYVVMMKLMFKANSVAPVSPEQLNLPHVKFFDNGVGFIRSGWHGMADTLLALRSGDGGKTHYAHDHQNRNAILLFKDGEYMIAESGRTSYRSPMHFSWDKHTRSSNTITFWDDSQREKSPATMILATENKHLGYLVSEAFKTYRSNYKVKKVRRRVLYLKALNSFVIWDDIRSPQTKSAVNWRLFFNNVDFKTQIDKLADDTIIVIRDSVPLKVFVKASVPDKYSFGSGWLHTGYSYSPGAKNEGKANSSISWTCTDKGTEPDINFYSYLGNPDWNVSFKNRVMSLKKDNIQYKINFLTNGLTVTKYLNGKNVLTITLNDNQKKN